jgi:hypothetical protein
MPSYNITADGNTASYTAIGEHLWIKIHGDFGSGVATIQVDIEGGVDYTNDTSATDDESFVLHVPVDSTVRVNLIGSTAPNLVIDITDSGNSETANQTVTMAQLALIKAKTDLIGTESEITTTTPVIGTKWRVLAFNRSTGEPVTGIAATITAKISIDHAAPVALTDVNPTEAEDGYYYFDITTAEQNGAVFELFPESSTNGVQVLGDPGRLSSNATLRAIEAKTALLGTGAASIDAPVLYSGNLRTLVLGDDYKAVNGRALVWTVVTSVVVSSCRLTIYQSSTRQMTITGSVVNNTGNSVLSFDIDEADWSPMTAGDAEYNVEARDSANNEITFIHSFIGSRKVRLIRKYT